MIVAQEVQEAVQGQNSQLGLFGMAKTARLAAGHTRGDGDFPKIRPKAQGPRPKKTACLRKPTPAPLAPRALPLGPKA